MVVSIFYAAAMEARRMVAKEVVNICALQCERGVTLRDKKGRG